VPLPRRDLHPQERQRQLELGPPVANHRLDRTAVVLPAPLRGASAVFGAHVRLGLQPNGVPDSQP
jgi:hypothetical protein